MRPASHVPGEANNRRTKGKIRQGVGDLTGNKGSSERDEGKAKSKAR